LPGKEAVAMGRLAVVILAVSLLAISGFSHAAGMVLFGFEDDTGGWRVPDWALEKEDHVARDLASSTDWASEGKKSMKVTSEFLGGKWSGAFVEIEDYYDWSAYSKLSVDVYIPKDAPAGLKGKIILTTGEEWKWTEMSKTVPLTPGQVTTITASLAPGSKDWKNTLVDDNFRKDVRKFGIRVENNKSEWKGMYYVDNIRLE
jgi:hypothetical protein